MTCERLATSFAWVFGCSLVFAAAPLALSTACTSDITHCGREFYSYIEGRSMVLFLGVAAGLAAVSYLLDVRRWRGVGPPVQALLALLAAGCLLVGLLLYGSRAPSVPVLVGMGASLAAVFVAAFTLLAKTSIPLFMYGTSAAFLTCSLVLCGLWLVWVFAPQLGGYHEWGRQADEDMLRRHFSDLTHFVLWSSPMLSSLLCLLVATFTFLRGRLHGRKVSPEPRGGALDRPHAPLDDAALADGSDFVGSEMRVLCLLLSLLAFAAWIAASMADEDLQLSEAVIRVCAAVGIVIALYIGYVLGFDRIRRAADSIATARAALEFARSDWCKGAFLLLAWPVLPLFFATEAVHQQLRFGLRRIGLIPDDGKGGRCLTQLAQQLWGSLSRWDKASVLSKSIWVGIIYFTMQVGLGQGVTLFLAWLGQAVASWHLAAVILVLFGVGMVMFALPPVPGFPIYLVAGMVLCQCCRRDGRPFYAGCLIAVAFSFFLKMSAILMQQQCIGRPFSRSVRVKQVVAVNTATMKAVRHILSRPGWDLAKVAVLVGGPDWPVSVLTGILRLSAIQMLLGSVPVLLVVTPVCLAGAFSYQAAAVTEGQERYRAIAQIFTMVSSVVLVGISVLAGVCIEQVQQTFKVELARGDWEVDDQEAEVREANLRDEARAKALSAVVRWPLLPYWLRLALLLGSWALCGVLYLCLLPFAKPFRAFSVAEKISDLPGGSALGLVNPSGWVACGLCAGGLVVVLGFGCWRSWRAAKAPPEPLEPLGGSVRDAGVNA